MVLSLLLAGCSKNQPKVSAGIASAPRAVLTTAAPIAAAPQSLPTTGAASSDSPQPVKTIATEKTEGPFAVSGQSFTFVKRVLRIDHQPQTSDDETVQWWELRDSQGNSVFRESGVAVTFANGTFEDTSLVDARSLKTKFGAGIAVEGMELPSAPNSGTWIQIFGLFDGKLVPFGPKMSTEGEFAGEAVDSFTPTAMIRGQQPQTVERDVLNFKVWTGDFSIIYPVLVDWMQAKVRPAWRCFRMTARGQVERCRYKIEVDPHRETKTLTFVRLFNEPEEGMGTPAHVVVKPDSKIEYLEAEAPVVWDQRPEAISISAGANDGDVWLHVKIDGQEGWIHTEEDFQAVGLQQSG